MDIQRFHQQFTDSSDPLITALRRVIDHATPEQAQQAAGDWILWGVNERREFSNWLVWSADERSSDDAMWGWIIWPAAHERASAH
jgi:hypothetical protein